MRSPLLPHCWQRAYLVGIDKGTSASCLRTLDPETSLSHLLPLRSNIRGGQVSLWYPGHPRSWELISQSVGRWSHALETPRVIITEVGYECHCWLTEFKAWRWNGTLLQQASKGLSHAHQGWTTVGWRPQLPLDWPWVQVLLTFRLLFLSHFCPWPNRHIISNSLMEPPAITSLL